MKTKRLVGGYVCSRELNEQVLLCEPETARRAVTLTVQSMWQEMANYLHGDAFEREMESFKRACVEYPVRRFGEDPLLPVLPVKPIDRPLPEAFTFALPNEDGDGCLIKIVFGGAVVEA